ncbi:hypothetical protein DTO164E3_7499 [Paecilomyces variotii]|nr:hypothetical protein DTO164E3_7499 [Paecilomyces variotii]
MRSSPVYQKTDFPKLATPVCITQLTGGDRNKIPFSGRSTRNVSVTYSQTEPMISPENGCMRCKLWLFETKDRSVPSRFTAGFAPWLHGG